MVEEEKNNLDVDLGTNGLTDNGYMEERGTEFIGFINGCRFARNDERRYPIVVEEENTEQAPPFVNERRRGLQVTTERRLLE